ncbi:MAG: zinc ABC transporter substrate-binding protein [Solirubrobacterales bacterium]|nr:zinc ABC transporter substrate-binding protein [Solirubrobacterales bacterium]
MGLVTFRACAVLALGSAPVGLGACGDADGTVGSGDGPEIVATTTQVADLARNVAGHRASVAQLLQPGSDPHDYEPRPSDARALAGAELVLRSGGDLDEWLEDIVDAAGSEAESVTLLDAVRARQEDHGGEAQDAGQADPHWWQDPRNAAAAVRRIRQALVKIDPDGRDAYTANAAAYVRTINALDRRIAGCFAAVPDSRRKLVTNHDALGPYAERYDIEVVGTVIPALSTQAQASAGEVTELVRAIRAEQVRTIFPETSLNPKLERAIARESGAEVGPALYADTLGAEGSPGATYLGSLRANARAMVAGFTDGRRRCALRG